MALTKLSRMLLITVVAVNWTLAARAEDPCASHGRRALVLSGGGLKGAFEAGAVYHLVIHRGCDFHDFAGVSVGALNGGILAQASPSEDEFQSHRELAERTEQMVAVWENLKGARDIVRHRKFAGGRFALFGAESMNDFAPLRHVIESAVSLDRLAEGRPLRVGVTSFADGVYREVWMNGESSNVPRARFMDYLYASSMLPVIARMPRIAADDAEPGDAHATQFADGGMRHVTPVASYFEACPAKRECAVDANRSGHESIRQLFVIGTSPYERGSESFPIADANCCRPGTQLLTNGLHVMRRAIALMADTPYRADLEAMWSANDLLQWRAELLDASPSTAPAASVGFPVESYNRDPQKRDAPSRPYVIVLVRPDTEKVDISDLLALSPAMVRDQLLAGCLAADHTIMTQFNLPDMSAMCEARFGNERKMPTLQLAGW
jgi:predicted acylesterase/phospholipase RssA